MKSSQLGWVLGLMGFLQAIAATADLAELMPSVAARWFQVIVGAAAVGLAIYTGKQAVMPADVSARR